MNFAEIHTKKGLSREEKRVISFLEDNQPVHADQMASHLKFYPSKLYALLTQMELDQLIIKKPGNYYVTS